MQILMHSAQPRIAFYFSAIVSYYQRQPDLNIPWKIAIHGGVAAPSGVIKPGQPNRINVVF
jgi:hypothetical protein